jgi:acetate kinase
VRVVVVNAGSSSLKLRHLGPGDEVLGSLDAPLAGARAIPGALREFLGSTGEVEAVGHRVVHGGDLRESVVVDDEVLRRLGGLGDLAPLHNAPALAAVAAARDLLADTPQVLCFDTAFHAGLPEAAARYAVPAEWHDRLGFRRLGFHGLSHDHASRRAADLLGRPRERLRLVTCHLGAGASLAAVAGGRSVDTTMGMTPNDGLVMATRSGSVDPGALVWLLREGGLSADDLDHALEHESGLLGLSGVSADLREVSAAADGGDRASRTAIEVYVHRLRAGIAAMAASMGGVDAVVFTGGVGEHSARIRAAACEGLAFLGVEVDAARNAAPGGEDADLAPGAAKVRVLRVRAREDLRIAAEVRALLVRRD